MRWLGAVIVVGMLCTGCGGDDGGQAAPVAPAKANLTLPSQVLGLKVVEEDIAGDVRKISDAYLDSLGLFSFRETDDLLRATLQVGRFNDVAEPERQRFRDAIVGQLGSSVPTPLRVGADRVYLTSGSDQSIFSWFKHDGFFVLSVRRDYPFSRTLLRRMLSDVTLA